MEVDSTAETQAPTQVPAPTTIDQKLDLILSKMDKLDTMVNYSNAAIAALSKIIAKDKTMISDLTTENTMRKESLNVMTLQQDSLSSRMSDLKLQECRTQLLLSNVPETRKETYDDIVSRNVEKH